MYTINYKKIILVLSVGIPLISCVLIPVDHTATAKLPNNLEVSITLTPLGSIQSDWERQLTVRYQEETVSVELLEDSGWWRGSNLYLHPSGNLLLFEGKESCVEVRLEPLYVQSIWGLSHSCSVFKTIGTNIHNSEMVSSSQKEAGKSHVSSNYFMDLYYVGTFQELPSQKRQRIQFYSFRESDEPKLRE